MASRKEAVEEAGGNAVVSKRLGVSEQRLSNWVERGVPVPYCARFERAVESRWMRWDERPSDCRDIWPELNEREDAPWRRPAANSSCEREAA